MNNDKLAALRERANDWKRTGWWDSQNLKPVESLLKPDDMLALLDEVEALRASKEKWRSLAMTTIFRTPNYSELSAEVDVLRARAEAAERVASIPPAMIHASNGGTAILATALIIGKTDLEHLKQHSDRRKETMVHIASQALREWIKQEDTSASITPPDNT